MLSIERFSYSPASVFVRLFCRVTPVEGDGNNLGDLSFRCFEAIEKSGIPSRVIATNMADLNAPKSRWAPYPQAFVEVVPDDFVNVVIGDSDELKRFYTAEKPNAAIVMSGKEVMPEHYDLVCTSTIAPRVFAKMLCIISVL